MRSDDDATAQRVSRLLDRGRGPEPPIEDEAWPAGWPSENPSTETEFARAAGLRFGVGSQWQVSVRAAAAVAVLAVLVIAVAAVLLLRGPAAGTAVPVRAPAPLGGVPESSAVGGPGASPAGEPTVTAADADPATDPAGGSAAGSLRVYVVGQVRRPGVVSLAVGARVEDAVDAAGGATEKADLAVMNLARKVVDGERIIVPRPGQKLPTPDPVAVPGAADPGAAGADPGSGTVTPGAPIDLNTATVAQLDALPGVGPVIAGRIVAWRQENGRFSSVDDLGEVQGIGDATLAKLRPLVRV
jgi:competence protein ComEA